LIVEILQDENYDTSMEGTVNEQLGNTSEVQRPRIHMETWGERGEAPKWRGV